MVSTVFFAFATFWFSRMNVIAALKLFLEMPWGVDYLILFL